MKLPTVDDLFGLGSFWDGDKAKSPNGSSYWKFMIFGYPDKNTYVLENNWVPIGEGWELEQVVKRLY